MSSPVDVLITVPFREELVNEVRGVSPRLRITLAKAKRPEDIPGDHWSRAEILYTDRILPAPEQAPALRWIQFHTAGIDHAIDHPILRKPDLKTTTLSGAAASKSAEYALMMMLGLGQHLPEIIAYQKRSEWPKDQYERFSPTELRGSTVGIVGYGSIGREIARLLYSFGATVLATKRNPMRPSDNGYMPEDQGDQSGDLVFRLYPSEALKSMLRECDFVVVTVPLSAHTRKMIGSEELAAFKQSAYLVDISRGGVIDSQALYNALKDRRIAGAALDVFEEEPLPAESPFWKLNNVILTPHISGSTPHYGRRAVALFQDNLHRYLADMPLLNTVDLERGY
jgi:phosphoglycerate dehydrogenase-like enzyme